MNYIIASQKKWHEQLGPNLAKKYPGAFRFISSPDELNVVLLNELRPRYLFFPHWSQVIPREIFENFECIIFHMTDLPFGRGGSPLQNLVARGVYETKVSALKCEAGLDAGPVYLKRPFSLHGNAEEIFLRANGLIEEMIGEIIEAGLIPQAQTGNPTVFSRRHPEESDIKNLRSLRQVYDYIRMLDCDGYPPAYLENDYFRLEFHRAALKDGFIHADVKISLKGEH